MTVQEIKNLFGEYKVGTASISDLKILLNAMGETAGVVSLNKSEGRPMLVASFYRKVLSDMGKTQTQIDNMIPADMTGPITATDLQLSLIQLGSDYIATPPPIGTLNGPGAPIGGPSAPGAPGALI